MKSQHAIFYEVKQSGVSQNAQKMCSAVQNREKRSETRFNLIKSCSQSEKCSRPMMHPEFQKWGSMGPWFWKMGPTLQNMASMTSVSHDSFKYKISLTLKVGAFGHS